MTQQKSLEYDVGLSFAGEQRDYVETVASELKARGIRVFFDDDEKARLWGKDLYDYLSAVYQTMCNFCVIFCSKEYAAKVWPNRERQSAQARALSENREYILPARFDDTPIPGLLDTVAYVDLREVSIADLVDLIEQKIGTEPRHDYLPPTMDRLYSRLGIKDATCSHDEVESHVWSFFEALRRMDADERLAVLSVIRYGCPADLPDNIHINTDLLRRNTGKSVASLEQILGGVRSLGFYCSVYQSEEHHDDDVMATTLGESYFFRLKWFNLSKESTEEEFTAMEVASEMVAAATEGFCHYCGAEFLDRLDFSQLANATASSESHEDE